VFRVSARCCFGFLLVYILVFIQRGGTCPQTAALLYVCFLYSVGRPNSFLMPMSGVSCFTRLSPTM
jgi:hypothetical protein